MLVRKQLSFQVVSAIESLLATIQTMAARVKPDGKLSEFLTAIKEQHQQKEGETGRQKLKYQVHLWTTICNV